MAIFFAETGETGLETCRVEEVREWHFPLRLAKSILDGEKNLHSHKLANGVCVD